MSQLSSRVVVSGLVVVLSACTVGADAGSPGGDTGDGGDTPDAAPVAACALPSTTGDAGDLTAGAAQQCNVPGSQGLRKWYRLWARMPGGTTDLVQVELWDGRGAFAAGAVAAGTYTLAGADLDPATCGVCVRAIGDQGLATQKEYFAKAGTVEITEVGGNGQPISATITNVTFAEIDAAKAPITGGCSAAMTRAKVSGTVTAAGGGGGGGGNCPAGVGG